MFDKIRRLMKSKSTQDLRAALAEIDVSSLRNALEAATAKRAELLLTADDAQVLAAERDVESARLAVDRAVAARAALETKLAAAEASDRDAQFLAQWTLADDEAEATVDFIRAKVVPAVAVIEEALARQAESDEKVRAVYRAILHQVGSEGTAVSAKSAPPASVNDRLRTLDILPGWLASRFDRHSSAV